MATLSGGNVQRAVLARELSEAVSVLIAANPVFGLDFAAVAEIHERILAARNDGAAVLLVSEDLDELLALSDRIVVMFDGRIVHETAIEAADIAVIGPAMAGHAGGGAERHAGRRRAPVRLRLRAVQHGARRDRHAARLRRARRLRRGARQRREPARARSCPPWPRSSAGRALTASASSTRARAIAPTWPTVRRPSAGVARPRCASALLVPWAASSSTASPATTSCPPARPRRARR